MATRSIKLNSPVRRIGLIAASVVCLIAVFFFAKWCFANSVATRVDLKEVAEFTVELAPNDPQTHYALAVLNEKSFLPGDLSKSLKEYETATALSPNDFRLWLALGNSRGQNGDVEGAEKALRQALKLAPNYANIHWALGNNLVRQGKTEEGFENIRRAAEGNPEFISPTISIASLIFDGDLVQIKKYVGDSPKMNAQLAILLTERKDFDGAMEIWNTLPAEEKNTTFKEVGQSLFRKMLEANKFRNAFRINSQIGEKSTTNDLAFEKINNGGFENEVKPKDAGYFEWQLGSGLQPQILFDDAQKHGGNRSLVILFNSIDGREFRTIAQTVIVEADKTYELEIFYRSDLKASSTLIWNIIETSGGKVLASTEPIAAKSDWASLKATFETGEETEAVTILLARDVCESTICPISGKVWFDDFLIR